ncbi:MAG: hypothetical protein K5872_03935 [Rhizobiaceae bacterium]|nr:hypothetical protein [Rhizobiaceae bacterium]MCV0405361.1 hypothetical protein [Rhizobiaceae bacterium]
MLTPPAAPQTTARSSSLAGLSLLVLAMSLPGAATAASGWFDSKADSGSFGDWSVFCDDSLACEAYAEELEGTGGSLFTLARRADDEGWRVSISLSGTRPDLTYGIQIGVVDEPEHLPAGEVDLQRGEVIPGTATSYHILPTGAGAERVVERLRSNPARGVKFPYMHVDFPDCGGAVENTLSFPLAGVTEALAWIDQKQNRPAGDSRVGIVPNDLGATIPADCSD